MVLDQMVGREAVASPALGVRVALVKAGGHVLSAMEMTAIGLLYPFELAAGDTLESPTGDSVP